MAINYDDALNARMSRIVRNYNRRAEGTKAPKVSVARLRKDYYRRADLNRELRNLEAFTKKKAFKDATAKVSAYDIELIKTNRKETIKFLQEQQKFLKARKKKGYPLEEAEIKNLALNERLLSQDIESASQDDLKAMLGSVHDYRVSFAERGAGYRGFLSEVEWVMGQVGIPQEDQEEFFEKMKQLNPQELYEIYEDSELVKRIYSLADSPSYGNIKLNTDDKDAKEKIEELMKTIDKLIAKVKK